MTLSEWDKSPYLWLESIEDLVIFDFVIHFCA